MISPLIFITNLKSSKFWRAFWRASWKFPAFKTSFKFGFLVQYLATFLFGFSVWCFEMVFNLLPDLLNTGFTTTEFSLFHGGEHLEAKLCIFWSTFLTLRWRSLLNRATTCENTSNTGSVLLTSSTTLTLLPKGLLTR